MLYHDILSANLIAVALIVSEIEVIMRLSWLNRLYFAVGLEMPSVPYHMRFWYIIAINIKGI